MTMQVLERTPDPDDYIKVGIGLIELDLLANHTTVVEFDSAPRQLPSPATQALGSMMIHEQPPTFTDGR